MKNKKLFLGFLAIVVVAVVLATLFLFLNKAPVCYFVHGKNICNFYAVVDIANNNPTISDFDKMMNLCRDMEDVPKKDKCFEYVAKTFALIDMNKAKEACDEIKGFKDESGHIVHTKEDCYSKIKEENFGVPNPAAVYCKEQEGHTEIREMPVWHNQYGVCIFPDGSECEEWEYYNGKCKPQQCKNVIAKYDCSKSSHPDVCKEEDVKILHDIIGNRSFIIENERDYKEITWNTSKHNKGWFFTWCCDIKMECVNENEK